MYLIVKDGVALLQTDVVPRFKNGTLVYPSKMLDVKESEVDVIDITEVGSTTVVVPPENLEDAKSEKLQALKQWHDAQTTAMKAKYSQSEVDSFLDKRNEAMAWRVDNTVATPYVTAMSGGNEEVRLMLLTSILAKVDATAQLEAYVLSKRDAVEMCSTQEELEAIVW